MTLLEHWYTRNFWTGVNDYWQCQQQASVGSYWWMSWLHNFGKYWGQFWTYMFYFRRKASARHGMWVCVDCGGLDVSGPSPPLLPPLALRSMPPWVVVRAVGALGSLRPATGLNKSPWRCWAVSTSPALPHQEVWTAQQVSVKLAQDKPRWGSRVTLASPAT